jgi:hypothetical protein
LGLSEVDIENINLLKMDKFNCKIVSSFL